MLIGFPSFKRLLESEVLNDRVLSIRKSALRVLEGETSISRRRQASPN